MKPARRPLFIAHRGESRDAPENTLAAFRLAWERGASAIELDVRLTADERVVVIHDADLRRVGRTRWRVDHVTADTLRTIDVGRWKHRRWAGERVPLLAEVLATVPRGRKVFIEIKTGPELVPALVRTLGASDVSPAQIVVMSFVPATMAAVVKWLPHYEACLLLTARQWLRGEGIRAAMDAARALGCASLDLEVHRRLDRAVVESAIAADMRLYTWTVNRLATARRLASAGIHGITTDRCGWMRTRWKAE